MNLRLRVAKRYLVQEITTKLAHLDRECASLLAHPGHAGAVLKGLDLVQDILNLFEEAGIDNPKVSRRLFVTRNFWNGQARKQHDNAWFTETGEYLATFAPQALL